ncbi:MAG: response regulator transcription factor [Cyclobacteriaceae bacterium]|nr:response regulator transcription factor [Cyclobacteriaceae bacterium]
MKPVKLCIVDDHSIVRDGLEAMLIGREDLQLIGSFSNGKELFAFIKNELPDVILLDISLNGMTGIEIARLVSEQYESIKIIMLSALTDEVSITDSIKSGAKGFLPKDTSKDELIEGLKTVSEGKRYFGSGISETVFNGYVKGIVSDNQTSTNPVLSGREVEIVKLFSEGLMYKEIADVLDISIKTVESHKVNIMKKLELKTTIDLVKYAIKEKLIDL